MEVVEELFGKGSWRCIWSYDGGDRVDYFEYKENYSSCVRSDRLSRPLYGFLWTIFDAAAG